MHGEYSVLLLQVVFLILHVYSPVVVVVVLKSRKEMLYVIIIILICKFYKHIYSQIQLLALHESIIPFL